MVLSTPTLFDVVSEIEAKVNSLREVERKLIKCVTDTIGSSQASVYLSDSKESEVDSDSSIVGRLKTASDELNRVTRNIHVFMDVLERNVSPGVIDKGKENMDFMRNNTSSPLRPAPYEV